MKKSSARVSKSEPKESKREPKGDRREPKGSQNKPKGCQNEQKLLQNQAFVCSNSQLLFFRQHGKNDHGALLGPTNVKDTSVETYSKQDRCGNNVGFRKAGHLIPSAPLAPIQDFNIMNTHTDFLQKPSRGETSNWLCAEKCE